MPKILYGAHKLLSLLPARTVVRALLRLDNFVYLLTGMQARKMENGIHPKHRLMHYHDFFISNIPAQSRVLDIGCGYGALAADVAANVGDVRVYGVDINPDNIRQALINYSHENLKFVEGDALKELPDEKFDVIILSNVLEHIEYRPDFLLRIKEKYNPEKFLIRVPAFERDWRVPLKQEMGVDWRLDATHYTEYYLDEFYEDMQKAGLKIESLDMKWGEIWSVLSV